MPSRKSIPIALKRQLWHEADYGCAICRTTTIQIHHIIPWQECQNHQFENLIVLCPTHHTQADKREIEKIALKEYKHKLSTSKIHEVVKLLFEPDNLFSDGWGPNQYSFSEKNEMILNLTSRKMLAGVIDTINWALVRCDICKKLISIDKAWTPQDNCMASSNVRLEAYCDFGCSLLYQELLRKTYPQDYYDKDYLLQNFVQILQMSMLLEPDKM